MTDAGSTPVERLTAAVQEFVNAIDPEAPVLLRGCVVAWESMKIDDDGQVGHKTSYATGEGTGMAATIGLLKLGLEAALEDIVHAGVDDDED